MRKIYSFMVGAVAMFAAVSCAQELKQDNQLPEGEVVVFEATVDGADTKAHLDGKVSKWDATDKITIFNETAGFEFATSEADVTNDGATARFTYVGNDFSGEKFMAVYPARTYTADVQAKTVNAYIPTYQGVKAGSYNKDAALAIAYTENTTLEFKNATALLKFTIKGSDVKAIEFYGNAEEGDDPIAITGNMLVSLNDDNTVKSVEGLETEFTWEDETTSTQYGTWVKCWADEANYRFTEGATYYAAIAPARFPKGVSVNFIYDNGEGGDAEPVKIKTTSNNIIIAANSIVDLGELYHDPNKVDASAYGVVGTFQGWDVANPVAMEYVSDGWIVAKDVELYKDDAFKFAKDKSWDVSYGTSAVTVLEDDKETDVVTSDGKDMSVSKNGKYNLYLNPNGMKVKVECTEEYTDLKVKITIDNKANWSPLYIYLESDGTAITPETGDLVTGNVYEVSGNYIGSSLNYRFISGTKKSEISDVTITKNGAQITFENPEEEKPLLYLKPSSNWKMDNARFAAYFFGNGEKWVSMKDSDSDGIYEVEIPSGYTKVIFCRMNPSTTANNWNNKWNQTGDLTIPTDGKNLFTVPSGSWDGATTTWSVK